MFNTCQHFFRLLLSPPDQTFVCEPAVVHRGESCFGSSELPTENILMGTSFFIICAQEREILEFVTNFCVLWGFVTSFVETTASVLE